MLPRFENGNLLAQRGLFLYIKNANERFMETGRWPGLEDVLTRTRRLNRLESVSLPSAQADTLLRLLWRYNITRHHLMPTLSSAAHAFSYTRRLFTNLRTFVVP
jgi:hypothetical protein